MAIPAPKWLASHAQRRSITQAVGSGPYKLAEYVKGDHFLLKANEDYWGPNKPKIAEIKIIFRNEAAVRASMVQAGEVQLATLLTPEAAKALPAHVVELTGEAARHPDQHGAPGPEGPAGAPGAQHGVRSQEHDRLAVRRRG